MRSEPTSIPSRGRAAGLCRAAIGAILSISAMAWFGSSSDGTAEAAAPATARLLDTRPGATTVDGELVGFGPVEAGAVIEVPVAGRGGVASDVAAAAINLTAVRASAPGHAVVHPCDGDLPSTSNLNYVPGEIASVFAIAPLDDDGKACVFVSATTHLVVDVQHAFSSGEFERSAPPARLVDTRPGGATHDDSMSGLGPVTTGTTLEIPVTEPDTASETDARVLSVTAVGATTRGHLTAHTCGTATTGSTVNFTPGATVANAAFVVPDGDGRVCVSAVGSAHVVVDEMGSLSAAEVLPTSRRLADTRSSGSTVDGSFAADGARFAGSTLTLDVAGRGDVPGDAGAAILNVTAVAARQPGHVTAHNGEHPGTSNVNYRIGETIANAVVAPLDADGAVCLLTSGTTDLVVDVVGWMPRGDVSAVTEPCPETRLLDRRIVALYGTDLSAAMGVLGEQPPAQAADRLASIAAPYEAGDKPVQGAFELIATIATSFPGDSGLYRSPSSAEHVQRYLDVANERGLLLILDIQPGQSDFMTELRRYEAFLREPNVHVALDPEWNVGPGQVPGQLVGQVDATEVNAVADYLARIVAEEGLPEKLLIVHQFQDRMVTNRELLRQPDGVAVMIHMDGFGTREQKLTTYSIVKADPPFTNGFKLFFDEDVNLFEPWEVLALDPVPDLISYQ